MLPVFGIVVGVSSLVLVVMLLALLRHVKVLAAAVAAFQRDVRPVLEEIRREGDRARLRMERTNEDVERIREGFVTKRRH